MPSIYLKGVSINYQKLGRGQPIILLHGIFADSRSYEGLIRILSRRYCMYAIDLPMHGKSESPKNHVSISGFSLISKDFINKLKIKNPLLCAHSAGCLIAFEYASKYRVKELVLIDPAGLIFFRRKFTLFYKFLIKTSLNILRNPVKSLKIIKIGLYNFSRNIFNSNFWTLVDDNYKKDYSRKIKEIKCPIRVFWGRYDELFPFKKAKQIQQSLKNLEFIPVYGGHDWPIFRPEEIKKYTKTI